MRIEVIVQNRREARAAEQAGADRLELVSAMSEGGLTPSYGTIKRVVEAVNIPVYVMVRPHSYHFCYDEEEMAVIKEDIAMIQELGASGIVFGSLTQEGEINQDYLEQVLNCLNGMGLTFHRAFDEVNDQEQAYQILCRYKNSVERVLTSGGAPKALDGLQTLKKLMALKEQEQGPELLIGSGLTLDNLSTLHQVIGAKEYHFGSGVRMQHSFEQDVDSEHVRRIRQLLGV